MSQVTTLQKAKMLMDKLVKMRINRSPLPTEQDRIYPVASLSNGRLLLSNGDIRQTPILKNIGKMQEQQTFEGAPANKTNNYLNTLSLNIAVPAKQTGKNMQNAALVFSNYLSSVLKPRLSAPLETGLPALIPETNQAQNAFQTPFALANLPQLAPKVESAIELNSKVFSEGNQFTKELQESLRRDFLGLNRGETETGNIQRFANLPLVQGYGTSYRLPQQETANYTRVSSNPFVLTGVVR